MSVAAPKGRKFLAAMIGSGLITFFGLAGFVMLYLKPEQAASIVSLDQIVITGNIAIFTVLIGALGAVDFKAAKPVA